MSRELRLLAAALLVLVWITGCGTQSIASLRSRPNCIHSFEVPVDCGATYDRIVRRARERYRIVPMAPHQPGISAELVASGLSGTIALWDAGRIEMKYMLSADLRQIDASRTQVDIYCATRADRKEARLWEQWANTPLER
jgi:hypothetical protein